MTGKCGVFGGPGDTEMSHDTGLSLYEPWEANRRPDIFVPAPSEQPGQPTWKRLRADFPYIALRFDHSIDRKRLQLKPFEINNPKTGFFVVGFLVDYGPAISTHRIVDLSPKIMRDLDLKTDDIVIVNEFV